MSWKTRLRWTVFAFLGNTVSNLLWSLLFSKGSGWAVPSETSRDVDSWSIECSKLNKRMIFNETLSYSTSRLLRDPKWAMPYRGGCQINLNCSLPRIERARQAAIEQEHRKATSIIAALQCSCTNAAYVVEEGRIAEVSKVASVTRKTSRNTCAPGLFRNVLRMQ